MEENKDAESIRELARRMAEKCPAVSLPDCPNHENHSEDCHQRGTGDGFYAAFELIKKMLDDGRYKSFEEIYERITEGQVAT